MAGSVIVTADHLVAELMEVAHGKGSRSTHRKEQGRKHQVSLSFIKSGLARPFIADKGLGGCEKDAGSERKITSPLRSQIMAPITPVQPAAGPVKSALENHLRQKHAGPRNSLVQQV